MVEQTELMCPGCQEVFETAEILKGHMKRDFQCVRCKEIYCHQYKSNASKDICIYCETSLRQQGLNTINIGLRI